MIMSERTAYSYLFKQEIFFNMATNIEEKLREVLEKTSKDQQADNKLSGFEKALEGFNELVDKGIIKERGYTLMTGAEIYNRNISFNIK